MLDRLRAIGIEVVCCSTRPAELVFQLANGFHKQQLKKHREESYDRRITSNVSGR
jgi:hypothetical protein